MFEVEFIEHRPFIDFYFEFRMLEHFFNIMSVFLFFVMNSNLPFIKISKRYMEFGISIYVRCIKSHTQKIPVEYIKAIHPGEYKTTEFQNQNKTLAHMNRTQRNHKTTNSYFIRFIDHAEKIFLQPNSV